MRILNIQRHLAFEGLIQNSKNWPSSSQAGPTSIDEDGQKSSVLISRPNEAGQEANIPIPAPKSRLPTLEDTYK